MRSSFRSGPSARKLFASARSLLLSCASVRAEIRTSADAEPVSDARLLTSRMLAATCGGALRHLLDVLCDAVRCRVLLVNRGGNRGRDLGETNDGAADSFRAETESRDAVWMPATWARISSVASVVRLRQHLHFACDDGKAAAGFARARGFDGGVQREQVGLSGDGGDEVDDVADAVAAPINSAIRPSVSLGLRDRLLRPCRWTCGIALLISPVDAEISSVASLTARTLVEVCSAADATALASFLVVSAAVVRVECRAVSSCVDVAETELTISPIVSRSIGESPHFRLRGRSPGRASAPFCWASIPPSAAGCP